MLGQRKLHEEAVDRVVGVELRDLLQELVLGGVGREPDVARIDPDLRGRLVLEPGLLVASSCGVSPRHAIPAGVAVLRSKHEIQSTLI